MNRNNYIPIQKLVEIAQQEGCILEQRTTCIRIKKGTSNNRLYIHGAKDTCRVHVNGFHIPDPEVAVVPPNGPVGTFVQMIRFDLPSAKILENYRHVCRELDKYAPDPKKPRARPAGLRGSQKRPVENVVQEIQVAVQETPEQTVNRLIADFVKKKALCQKVGAPLSPKTIKEFREKIAALGGKTEAIV